MILRFLRHAILRLVDHGRNDRGSKLTTRTRVNRADTLRPTRPKVATLLTLGRKTLSTFETVAFPPWMIALSARSLKSWAMLVDSAELSQG